MKDLEQRFVELAKKREKVKEFLKETDEEFTQLMQDLGVGSMFQDDEGLVYKIEKPKGTFTPYYDISYVRTKKATEKRGSLSKKEAQEAGFSV